MEIRCGHLTASQPQSPVIPALSFLTDYSGWAHIPCPCHMSSPLDPGGLALVFLCLPPLKVSDKFFFRMFIVWAFADSSSPWAGKVTKAFLQVAQISGCPITNHLVDLLVVSTQSCCPPRLLDGHCRGA